jgi:hypothetical protein
MKRLCLLLTGLLLLPGAVSSVFAQPIDSSAKVWKAGLHGYVKVIPSVFFRNRADSLFSEGFLHNRLNFRLYNGKGVTLRAEMRNRLFYGEVVRLQPGFGRAIDDDTGLVRLSVMWADEPGFVMHTTFDRLLLQIDRDKYSVSIGRQRINWGINTIWNPNDIFNAWNFLDFDYEERPGSDAIRFRYFTSPSSSFELAWSPVEEIRNHTAAMMYRFNRKEFDWQIIAGKYREDLTAGAGFAGHLGNTGFKGEASCFYPYDPDSPLDPSWSVSLTLDRTLKKDWYLSGAILYNSNEQDFAIDVLGANRNRISARQLMPWRWNFYLSSMKQLTPPLSAGMAFSFSPADASTLFLPTLSWSVANNFDLDLIGQSFFNNSAGNYSAVLNSVYLRMRGSF